MRMERNLMTTSPGSYRDPFDRPCWETCFACGRCEKKGSSACPHNNTCSGRFDPRGQRHAHPDDYCRCKEGVLQWVTQKGKLAQSRLFTDPFKGAVEYETTSQDERDYNAYVNEMRERLDNPDYDPVQFTDGTSTQAWEKKHRTGK